jgi:hypothetical protein
MTPPTTKVEAKVPRNAKNIVGPMFSKKELAFILKPASKMMGGSCPRQGEGQG